MPRRKRKRQDDDIGLFWLMLRRIDEASLAAQQRRQAEHEAEMARLREADRKMQLRRRQAQLASSWKRAMVELYPEQLPENYPSGPRDLDAARLEQLAVQVYTKLGYETEHRGGAGDGGVDVLVRSQLLGETLVIQCKQYQAKVQPNVVRETRGALRGRQKGVIWAPGGFTPAANAEAERMRIELYDEQRILELVERAYPAPDWTPTPLETAVSVASPVVTDKPPSSEQRPAFPARGPLGLTRAQWVIVGLAAGGVIMLMTLLFVIILAVLFAQM
ncbi:MAG: restriction endonuclease [Anaerolineales bacterium]|nr:restriction endonuclease [Anaerolineales bacterium]